MTLAGTCRRGVISRGPLRDPEECPGCHECLPDIVRPDGSRWTEPPGATLTLLCGHLTFTRSREGRVYCSPCGCDRELPSLQPERRAAQLEALAADYDARAKRGRAELVRETEYADAGGHMPRTPEWFELTREVIARNERLAGEARERAARARADAAAAA